MIHRSRTLHITIDKGTTVNNAWTNNRIRQNLGTGARLSAMGGPGRYQLNEKRRCSCSQCANSRNDLACGGNRCSRSS